PGDVPMAGQIFSYQDITGEESALGTISRLKFRHARQIDDILTPGGLVIVREGWGRTAVQRDGSVSQVIHDRGKLLRGHILEVRFSVSTGINTDDLHQASSFMTTV